MLKRVAAIIFPKSKSISDILHRRYGQGILKKYENLKLNYCLHRAKLN